MTIEFCIPIYNEEQILKQNVELLLDFCKSQDFEFSWQIVIINNGSTDSSGSICEELKSDLVKIKNIADKGKGRAIKTYFLKSSADILVYMDVDLAVSLKFLPLLLKPILEGEADLVMGSRLLPESITERSWFRTFSSKVYNFISQIILSHNFSDLQCGFKAVKNHAFKQIAPYINDNKWFFDTELIAFTKAFEQRIKEIPVEWKENRYEERQSKISVRNVFFHGMVFILNSLKLKSRLKNVKKT